MTTVTSRDGTRIAYDKSGRGPALILVAGALQSRAVHTRLAELLAERFTVINYDRRGRGESTDTPAYAVERELEDLTSLLQAAGGTAALYGSSSGATLALKAAASGLPVSGIVLWEPNFLVDHSRPPLPLDYVAHLKALVGAGRRGDAVEYFMRVAVGLPEDLASSMRQMPVWPALEAAAHTLVYDGEIVAESMRGEAIDPSRWSSVRCETLVLHGGTTPWLSAGAQAIASALPNATCYTLNGQPHDVAAEAIAPSIADFLGSTVGV